MCIWLFALVVCQVELETRPYKCNRFPFSFFFVIYESLCCRVSSISHNFVPVSFRFKNGSKRGKILQLKLLTHPVLLKNWFVFLIQDNLVMLLLKVLTCLEVPFKIFIVWPCLSNMLFYYCTFLCYPVTYEVWVLLKLVISVPTLIVHLWFWICS